MKNLHNKILHAIHYTELKMDFTSRAPQESSQPSIVHMIPQKNNITTEKEKWWWRAATFTRTNAKCGKKATSGSHNSAHIRSKKQQGHC